MHAHIHIHTYMCVQRVHTIKKERKKESTIDQTTKLNKAVDKNKNEKRSNAQ